MVSTHVFARQCAMSCFGPPRWDSRFFFNGIGSCCTWTSAIPSAHFVVVARLGWQLMTSSFTAHKLLMSWLDHLTFCPTIFRERLAVSIAILFAGLAGAGLARVLRVWTAPTLATCVGLAIFTALAWAPTVTILQPEWTAALLCVGAVSFGSCSWPTPCRVLAFASDLPERDFCWPSPRCRSTRLRQP